MRLHLPLLFMLKVGCKSPAPLEPSPATELVVIDYHSLYGAFHSMSVIDHRLAAPELLPRIRFEASALSSMREDASIESWARAVLFSALGRHGAIIMGPPVGNDAEPTLHVRDAYFGVGYDDMAVVVEIHPDDGRYMVGLRRYRSQESLCPPALELSLPYVALHGTVQRSDGAVVALWHEVAFPSVDAGRAQIEVNLSPGELCALVPVLFEQEEHLSPSGGEYEVAAGQLVTIALQPFLP